MKISNKQDYTLFGSQSLHFVNIKRVTAGVEDGFVKAVFSKLDPNSAEDIEAIIKIKDTWKEKLAHTWIGENFLNLEKLKKTPLEFHCIELINEKSLGERIIGLSEILIPEEKQTCHLRCIVSKAENQFDNKNRQLKNIGEMLLGAVINDAQKKHATSLDIFSILDAFYDKTFLKSGINFEKVYSNFKINSEEFGKYIAYIEKKFKMSFSEKTSK